MSSQGPPMTQSAGARIVLADDDVLWREGLASLLERAGFSVVGQAGTADELLELVREHALDLAIVDIRMPPGHGTEGLEAAVQIRKTFPGVGLLVLSAYVEVDQAMDLVATGRRVGYLLKSRVVDVDEFMEVVRRILDGGFRGRPGARPGARRRQAKAQPPRGSHRS